jgi:hypothetical protein
MQQAPPEILLNIFSRCTIRSLCRIEQTNKRLQAIVQDDLLWKRILDTPKQRKVLPFVVSTKYEGIKRRINKKSLRCWECDRSCLHRNAVIIQKTFGTRLCKYCCTSKLIDEEALRELFVERYGKSKKQQTIFWKHLKRLPNITVDLRNTLKTRTYYYRRGVNDILADFTSWCFTCRTFH